jgi:arginine deiminase
MPSCVCAPSRLKRERERERQTERERERETERERERKRDAEGEGLKAQVARTHPGAILKYDEGASCSSVDTNARGYVVSIEREEVGRGRGRQHIWSCIWQGYT